MIPHTKIDNALVRLREDQEGKPYLEFQPRKCGLVLWYVVYRDRHYDGWTGDEVWAFPNSFDEERKKIEPLYDREPTGWTVDQISRAYHWAFNKSDGIRQIAEKYSFQPQQMRAAE